jgi:hypothetical protein
MAEMEHLAVVVHLLQALLVQVDLLLQVDKVTLVVMGLQTEQPIETVAVEVVLEQQVLLAVQLVRLQETVATV